MKYNPVINEKTQSITYRSYKKDIAYLQSGEPYVFFNVENGNYLQEIDSLDFTLVEDIDVFVIERLDEYSIAFINILLLRFPQKKIICLDNTAQNIWKSPSITCENPDVENQQMLGKSMYIFSDDGQNMGRHMSKVESSLVYSSLFVMQSLCWARKRTTLGEKNPDKVILLIEFGCKNAGMGDIVVSAQQYIRLARQRGWYPVVNLTLENQYISHSGDNMWEYYFLQPSEISVQDAMQSKYVIRGSENNFGLLPWTGNPLCNMNDARREKVFLKPELVNEFQRQMPAPFKKKKRILAVIARGSDLAKCTHLQVDIERMIEEVKRIFDTGFEYMFLATETQEYLEAFQQEFNEKIFFVEQKRISYDYEQNEYRYIAELLDVEENQRMEWGKKYLMITYFLSCCDAIVYSITCGALRLAINWKESPFEFIQCMYQSVRSLEDKSKENIIHIQECPDFFAQNNCTVIYGLGDVAEMIYPIFEEYREKIIGCDKRAAFENYNFHNLKVITPEELVAIKDNIKILITSPRCGAEIKNELLRNGIEKSRIIQLDY